MRPGLGARSRWLEAAAAQRGEVKREPVKKSAAELATRLAALEARGD
ncbi:hypothetical protein [Amycolatopsis minnesotensis]|uniref:Uncharacterized protein n=1 Tax=Amycolatopsis minnesotensis TaxID=337894 RepID=A0ABN2SA24_9PSEU